ncbi:hypothetical protein GWK47_016979 [Chionoecetes opilio]|uniref:RNase H type-1 domain-containing protein n=1 Tax=Chionoecetes opilio TaxID=41210 RepID=A0A8J4XSZ4_CHIOP|nr:hypothetical protein GWK47_016979 [Chionoecetes opilio]
MVLMVKMASLVPPLSVVLSSDHFVSLTIPLHSKRNLWRCYLPFTMLVSHPFLNFTFSLTHSALHSLDATTFKDNVQLLSSTHHHLLTLYRLNSDVFLHWVPSHVGVSGSERADEAARRASTAPEVTFPLLPSYAQIKSSVNRAALQASQLLLNDAVEHGSRSATWYITATRQTPHLHLSRFTPPVVRQLVRLRLGFHCSTQILGDAPALLTVSQSHKIPLSTTCFTAQHPTHFAI